MAYFNRLPDFAPVAKPLEEGYNLCWTTTDMI